MGRVPKQSFELSNEVARWRKSFREAQAVIAEQNRILLALFLRDRLADASDFEIFIGSDAVTSSRTGRIDWTRADRLVSELLASKPHLAATQDDAPFKKSSSALEWFQQQSV